mmetsp:Transcript_95741/g.139853  ORF Transcript_95741/g.139853 Transcript_95741/m.139853 type:complete len:278 (+) Transcript_95741:368-1201(+)
MAPVSRNRVGGGRVSGRDFGSLAILALHEDPLVVTLLHGNALRGYAPHGLWEGSGIVEVVVGKGLFHSLGGGEGAVVGDCAVNMVNDVGGTDLVVEEVEDSSIWPVDGHEGTLDVAPVFAGKVGHVGVGVLEPCVEDKPHVGDAQRGHVKSEHVPYTKRHRPSSQQANHGNNANIREPHLLLPCAREKLSVLVSSGEGPDGDKMVGDTADGSTSHTGHEVRGPAEYKVGNHTDATVQKVTDAFTQGTAEGLALGKGLLARLHGVRHVGLTLQDMVGF